MNTERRRTALWSTHSEVARTQVGYHVAATSPRLKVRAYDTARLAVGAENVVEAFRRWLETRLARTRFKSSSVVLHLVQEFRDKVLPVFSGDTGVDFRLRLHGKDDGTKEWEKLERAIDSGCRIRDGVMTLSPCASRFLPFHFLCTNLTHGAPDRMLKTVFEQSPMRLSFGFRRFCRAAKRSTFYSSGSVTSASSRLTSLLPTYSTSSLQGFGDSVYLARRIKGAFAKDQVSLLRPEVPTPAAISEGAMRLYLAETLVPRHVRHALGVETAVDWSTAWRPGMETRQVLSGSGGTRLIRGKFTPIVQEVRCVDDRAGSLWSDAKLTGRRDSRRPNLVTAV